MYSSQVGYIRDINTSPVYLLLFRDAVHDLFWLLSCNYSSCKFKAKNLFFWDHIITE